ncbi:hypothetical protein IJG72_07430 [bacterium]|nr:hypothetical protein [bacterium]
MKAFKIVLFLIFLLILDCKVYADINTPIADDSVLQSINDKKNLFRTYLMFSYEPIKKIKSANEGIITATIMTTVQNRRDTVILEPKSNGNTKLEVEIGKEKYEVCIGVNDSKITIYSNCKLFNFVPLDKPDSVSLKNEVRK